VGEGEGADGKRPIPEDAPDDDVPPPLGTNPPMPLKPPNPENPAPGADADAVVADGAGDGDGDGDGEAATEKREEEEPVGGPKETVRCHGEGSADAAGDVPHPVEAGAEAVAIPGEATCPMDGREGGPNAVTDGDGPQATPGEWEAAGGAKVGMPDPDATATPTGEGAAGMENPPHPQGEAMGRKKSVGGDSQEEKRKSCSVGEQRKGGDGSRESTRLPSDAFEPWNEGKNRGEKCPFSHGVQ
jgi:hypothetical protein